MAMLSCSMPRTSHFPGYMLFACPQQLSSSAVAVAVDTPTTIAPAIPVSTTPSGLPKLKTMDLPLDRRRRAA